MESLKEQIKLLIEEGQKFTFQTFCYPHPSGNQYGGEDTPDWLSWKMRAINVVNEVVSESSPALRIVKSGIQIHTQGNSQDNFLRAKELILKALNQTIEVIENDKFSELKQPKSKSVIKTLSNKVFVVHGHDHGLKTEVENFLHEIGLEPVVLHKEPDEGQTIIEKFEKHSDVGYAFILLTPDEAAYLADQEMIDDKRRIKEKRARPNVIFEFGYFVGKLGRNRVCCLYKGDVSSPSDLGGLIYKKILSSVEAEGFGIIKELKAAGYRLKL